MAKVALRSDILLASPSDVRPLLKSVEEAIATWNAINADTWSLVFRPIRWERDVVPAWGGEPQECINRELVDAADGLIALFWHRVGAPTEKHISGTVEEIERFAARGKRPAVYINKEPLPSDVDVSQLAALREYESSARPRGLIFSFADPEELHRLCTHYLTALAPILVAQHRSEADAQGIYGGWNDIGDAHTLRDALKQMVYLRRQLDILLDRLSALHPQELEAAAAFGGTDWERAMILFEEAAMHLPESAHLQCRRMLAEMGVLRAALMKPLLQGGPNLRAARDHLLPALVDYMLGIEDVVREEIAQLGAQATQAR